MDRVIHTEKVDEFNFLNGKSRNLRAVVVKDRLMQEPPDT